MQVPPLPPQCNILSTFLVLRSFSNWKISLQFQITCKITIARCHEYQLQELSHSSLPYKCDCAQASSVMAIDHHMTQQCIYFKLQSYRLVHRYNSTTVRHPLIHRCRTTHQIPTHTFLRIKSKLYLSPSSQATVRSLSPTHFNS